MIAHRNEKHNIFGKEKEIEKEKERPRLMN
jgi:hypothetical protein